MKINKWVIAITLIHIDKIKNFDVIAFCFQETSCVPHILSLRIENDKACIRLHNVRLGIEPCFAGTRTAAHKYIQISAVLMTVKTDFRFLRQNLVFFGLCFILILFVYLSGIAPMCRTVFFTAAIISCGGYINGNTDNIGAYKNEDSF